MHTHKGQHTLRNTCARPRRQTCLLPLACMCTPSPSPLSTSTSPFFPLSLLLLSCFFPSLLHPSFLPSSQCCSAHFRRSADYFFFTFVREPSSKFFSGLAEALQGRVEGLCPLPVDEGAAADNCAWKVCAVCIVDEVVACEMCSVS